MTILLEGIYEELLTSAGWYDTVGRTKVSYQLQQCFEDWFFMMRHPGNVKHTVCRIHWVLQDLWINSPWPRMFDKSSKC